MKCVTEMKSKEKCGEFDKKLLECAGPAFRKANTTPGYHYWLIN